MKIGIVVTMFNCVEYSKAMVESIKTETSYELILIDDYSVDGTKHWLSTLTAPNVHKIIDPDTISLGQKWNLGILKAEELGCQAALVCNNDILFSPETIDALVRRFEKGDRAIVSAHNLRGEMPNPQDILTYKVTHATSEAEHPDFSCFLVDIYAWKMVGGFDEGYVPCYFEDNDFHTILRAHGYVAIATTSAPYYHYGSKTQNSVEGGLCKGPQFEANRAYFTKKFGCDPNKVDIELVRNKLGIVINE